MKSIIKIWCWSAVFIGIQYNVNAQLDSTSVNERNNAEDQSAENSIHSFYTSLGYGNNMVLASTVTTAQPYYYGSLIYGIKNQFYLSASTFHMPKFDHFIAYSALGLSYNHTFNSWFDISAGAYRYIVPQELSDTLFSSFSYGDITIGVDWRLIYTKISLGGIMSESSRGFMQIRNSRYFQTPEFINNKAYISFDPYFNILMGSLTKTIKDGETVIGIDYPIRGSGSGSGSGSGQGSGSGTSSETVTSTYFGIMELDFGLPVGINVGNVTIEAEPGYVIPMYTDPLIVTPDGFTLMINCFIKIF